MLFLPAAGALDRAHILPAGIAGAYLVYPVQTLICAGMLAWFWKEYRLEMPLRPGLAVGIGVLVLIIWILPGRLLHLAPRLDGFNPDLLVSRPALYWLEVVMRCVRIAIVVPLLEEIFWRGFLLRWLIDENFDAVPLGRYALNASLITAVAFMLEHQVPDYAGALAAGLLFNMVAFRTRSLSSCVLAHAVTNALLGAYILETRQWGFW